jgi:hypothetical protein
MSNDHRFIGPVSVSHYLFGLPPTSISTYGSKSPYYWFKHRPGTTGCNLGIYDLEELYINNIIPLAANENLEQVTSLGDIKNQSIVEFRLGTVERYQQVRVTFYFSIPPGMQNKLQIFENTVLKDEYTTPLVVKENGDSDWLENGSRSILVTGDGKHKTVYFRPASFANEWGDWFFNTVFFKGAEAEMI